MTHDGDRPRRGDGGAAAGRPPGRPRTVVVDDADLESVAPARAAGSRPDTLDAEQAAPVADTLFAEQEDSIDAIAWPNRPGVALRLVRWAVGLAAGLLAAGLLGSVVAAVAARLLNGDGFWSAMALSGLALLIAAFLALILIDIVALSRLGSVTALRRAAETARASDDPVAADAAARSALSLYSRRADMEWAIAAFRDDQVSASGAAAVLDALDDRVLSQLDRRARRVAAFAARRAAVITAVSPFPLLDMMATIALTTRAASRIGAVYGIRPGRLGTVSLLRRAFFTVIAAGAIDAADDLVGDLLGSGLATRLSRRAGVGVLNGLLVARLCLAIVDEVRPLPWRPGKRPSPHAIVREIFTGAGS